MNKVDKISKKVELFIKNKFAVNIFKFYLLSITNNAYTINSIDKNSFIISNNDYYLSVKLNDNSVYIKSNVLEMDNDLNIKYFSLISDKGQEEYVYLEKSSVNDDGRNSCLKKYYCNDLLFKMEKYITSYVKEDNIYYHETNYIIDNICYQQVNRTSNKEEYEGSYISVNKVLNKEYYSRQDYNDSLDLQYVCDIDAKEFEKIKTKNRIK